MLSMLRKISGLSHFLKQSRKSYIYKHFLYLTTCIFFSACALAPLSAFAAPLQGKKIDLTYQNSSIQHYYSKIRLFPTAVPNNPACSEPRTGMLYVDMGGNLKVCNGAFPENVTSPWETTPNGQIVYAKDFMTARVAIGNNNIPNTVANFFLSEPNANGLNQIEFRPRDGSGNVVLKMHTGGTPITTTTGFMRQATFLHFMVGDATVPLSEPFDARIAYVNDGNIADSGLKFYSGDFTTNPFVSLRLYRGGGRVDFGDDETGLLPPRHATRTVKVYGNTKADFIVLDSDGLFGVNAPSLLKVQYMGAGTGGYYAVYAQ